MEQYGISNRFLVAIDEIIHVNTYLLLDDLTFNPWCTGY